MAMAEYAWTSFTDNAKIYRGIPQGGAEKRIHACQKPIALYEWLLSRYAKEGDRILDTHVGSASSLIACHNLGFDAVGFEIDEDYYKSAKQRLDGYVAQVNIFDLISKVESKEQKDDRNN